MLDSWTCDCRWSSWLYYLQLLPLLHRQLAAVPGYEVVTAGVESIKSGGSGLESLRGRGDTRWGHARGGGNKSNWLISFFKRGPTSRHRHGYQEEGPAEEDDAAAVGRDKMDMCGYTARKHTAYRGRGQRSTCRGAGVVDKIKDSLLCDVLSFCKKVFKMI